MEKTGQNRTINRYKWPAAELEDKLADDSTHNAQVFGAITDRLKVRKTIPAFHPMFLRKFWKLVHKFSR